MSNAPPSPERSALAAAIENAQQVAARRAATEAALEAATQRVYRCHDAVGAAETAIKEAEGAVAGHLVDVAAGVTVETPLSPRQARARLAEAEIALADARAERDAVKQHAEQFAHDSSADIVRRAAIVVLRVELRPVIATLVAEADRLRGELQATLWQLAWFRRQDVLNKADHRVLEIGLADYRDAQAAGAVKWDPVLAALCSDADATLAALIADATVSI